jgi:hypothetical protein
MRVRTRIIGIAAAALAATQVIAQGARPQDAAAGSLAAVLLRGDAVPAAIREGLPREAVQRAAEYDVRRAAFRTALAWPVLAGPQTDPVMYRRQGLERALVSLVAAAGVEQSAAAYVAALPGGAAPARDASALAEAAAGEGRLKAEPASPIAPVVYLHIAERYRCGIEEATPRGDAQALTAHARKYQAFFTRARQVADPLLRAAAEDLDRATFVCADAGKHPRDFLPPG